MITIDCGSQQERKLENLKKLIEQIDEIIPTARDCDMNSVISILNSATEDAAESLRNDLYDAFMQSN